MDFYGLNKLLNGENKSYVEIADYMNVTPSEALQYMESFLDMGCLRTGMVRGTTSEDIKRGMTYRGFSLAKPPMLTAEILHSRKKS